MAPPKNKVNRNDLSNAAKQLQEIQKNATGIMELAHDAEADLKAWGLLGEALFAWWADSYADEAYKHLAQMGECLTKHVEAIDTAGKNYQAVEDGVTAAMNKLLEEIDKH